MNEEGLSYFPKGNMLCDNGVNGTNSVNLCGQGFIDYVCSCFAPVSCNLQIGALVKTKAS